MRTEDDLRGAFTTLERHVPDVDTVLHAVREGDRRRHRVVRGWWLPSAVTAGAAAATAIALVATTGGPAGPVAPGSARPPQGTDGAARRARSVLLAASENVAHARPGTGRNWKTAALAGNYVTVGPADDPYVILVRSRSEKWTARSTNNARPFVHAEYAQHLGVRFASAADKATWRRDGGPTTWVRGQAVGLAGISGFVSTSGPRPMGLRRGKLTVTMTESQGSAGATRKVLPVGGHSLSVAELRALPADPARLKKLILAGARYKTRNGDTVTELDGGVGPYLFENVPRLLEMPVKPAVRAALYRVLADAPGARSLGTVRDATGRRGAAVAMSSRHKRCGDATNTKGFKRSSLFASCTVQQRLIIDQKSGMPLAEELRYTKLPDGKSWSGPGGLFSYEIFTSARWTDAAMPMVEGQKG